MGQNVRWQVAERVRWIALAISIGLYPSAHAAEPGPLVLETSIALGSVSGRIDHLAVDVARRRLYVAELGNNSVAVIDLDGHKLLRTLTGFDEPQGIAYVAATDQIYVANGGDGSVRILNGADWASIGQIALGGDADNVRVDPAGRYVVVGYGSGALALIDPAERRKLADVPLHGHPESFQLTNDGRRAYVNVPSTHEIAVIDIETRRQIASWQTGKLRANFPMALSQDGGKLWVVFRSPARLVTFDTSGVVAETQETCGDSDDVFLDERRMRTYVICGSGQVENRDWSHSASPIRLSTAEGARTGLFVPGLDRLYVAARATSGTPASIQIYQPSPPPR